ncbi:MAG: TIGR03364 family FAD-dependent oxidoreductase [Siphonobacter aquaeclarae]|nr:TIGR03364 family FAD-dependent oxidoreductase [Siphonobacter aquaeclarae]
MSEKTYDFVVIGGGILGTFHACHAARLGLSVLLLEKDYRPVQATVRNFGQVVPSGMAGKWFDYGLRSLHFYKEMQASFDLSARANGSVYIASDEDEARLLHEVKASFDARGYASEQLTKGETLRRYPSIRPEYAREALFFPEEISVEPHLLINRIHAYLRERYPNLTQRFGTAAVGCEPAGAGARVTLAGGERISVGKVLVCGGGEFGLLFPEVFRTSGIIVSKLQMMRIAAPAGLSLPGNILTGLTIRRYESFETCPSYPSLQTPEHLRELKEQGIHILFKQATDGSIILGDSHSYAGIGEVENLGFQSDAYINELMFREAERIVGFPVRNLIECWSGYYPQHADGIFEYDVDSHIHIRTAIGGKGMTASGGYGEEVVRGWFGGES